MKNKYWIYWTSALLFFASFYTLLVPLPLYLTDLQIPDWQLTIILGGFGIAGLLIRPVSGIITDTYGFRNVIMLGTLLLSLGAAFTSFTTNPFLLFILRFIQAAGYVAFTTSVTAKIADMIEAGQRSKVIALFGTAANVSMTITPAAVNSIMPVIGYEGAFYLSGGLALLAGILVFVLTKKDSKSENRIKVDIKKIFFSVKQVKILIIISALYGFGFGAFLQFLPLLVERRSLGNSGLYYMLYGICLILSRVFAGPYLDKYNRYSSMAVSFILMGIGLGIFAFTYSNISLIYLAVVFMAFSGAVLHPLLITIHVEEISMIGLASAIFYLGFDSGIGIGAWLLSPIFEYYDMTGIYFTACISTIVGIYLVNLIRKNKKIEKSFV